MAQSTTKELLKDYLLEGAQEALEKQTDEKKAAAKKRSAEKVAQIRIAVAQQQKSQYLAVFDKAAETLSNKMVDEWNAENIARKEIKNDATALNSAIKAAQDKLFIDKNTIIAKISYSINNYIECCKTINSKDVKTFDEVKNMIFTNAERDFTELKNKAQAASAAIAKAKIKLAKSANIKLDSDFDAEHISQKKAEIPLKIEDQIQEIKDKLDKVLGKFLTKAMNPDLPEFDIDVVIAKIMSVLSPVMSCISPLEAVGGKVPILGDLTGVMSMMSSSAGDKKVSKEDLKKLVPNYPEPSSGIMDKAKGIMEDIMAVAIQLPMLLINVILEMINVIYSKLKIITSVIPLGSFFPLTLIGSAIESVPKIIKFIWQVPTLMYAAVKGLIKQKFAEAMALSVPSPHINMDSLTSNIQEVDDTNAEKSSTKFKPDEKKIDYSDANKVLYGVVEGYGYTKTDLARILMEYKKIYDGSNTKITKYSPSGKTVSKSELTRHNPSPEDYLSAVLPNIGHMESGIPYDEFNKVASVVGGEYWLYEDQIKAKEPNDYVVTAEEIER